MIDALLLLALPASGKSEVRTFIASQETSFMRDKMFLGDTIQLDDFPYVHMMRRIDEELSKQNLATAFFSHETKTFHNGFDWGTLIELVNEDYKSLVEKNLRPNDNAGAWIVSRIQNARKTLGLENPFEKYSDQQIAAISDAIEKDASELATELRQTLSCDMEGKTVLIEFARGGPDGSSMPLVEPHGYHHSISKLSSLKAFNNIFSNFWLLFRISSGMPKKVQWISLPTGLA